MTHIITVPMDYRHLEREPDALPRTVSGLSLKSLTISIVPSESDSVECDSKTTPSLYGYKFGSVECCNDHNTIPRHRKHRHSTHGVLIRDEYYSAPSLRVLTKKKLKKHPVLLTIFGPAANSALTTPAPTSKEKPKSLGKSGLGDDGQAIMEPSPNVNARESSSAITANLEEWTRTLEQTILSTKVLLERACKELPPSHKSSNGSRRIASPFESQPSPPTTPPNGEEKMEAGGDPCLPVVDETLEAGEFRERFLLELERPVEDMNDVRLLANANLRLMKGLQQKFDGLKELQVKMIEDNKRLAQLLEEAEAAKAKALITSGTVNSKELASEGFGDVDKSFKFAAKSCANSKAGNEIGPWDASPHLLPELRHKRRSTVASLPFFRSSSGLDELKSLRKFSATSLIGWTKTSQPVPGPGDALEKATMHLPKLERYPCIRKD